MCSLLRACMCIQMNVYYYFHVKSMLSLLFKSINPQFNESYYADTYINSLKSSVLNIITNQRKTITKLQNQLLHSNQPLGTVMLTQVWVSNSDTTVGTTAVYSLTYSNHILDRTQFTAFYVNVYDARFVYEQIRDYIGEYEPLGIRYLSTHVPHNNLQIKFNSNQLADAIAMFESIINGTAQTKPLHRNRAYHTTILFRTY